MNLYSFMSACYDLLDRIWFSEKGKNPRDIIEKLIPNQASTVLDMCCGTFSNGLPIAKKNPNNKVIGLDRSEAMLNEARRKVRKAELKNVELLCKDATQTGFKNESFDYIIIGLVLHECNEMLWERILSEAHRLLKSDGKLIILEWDKQKSVSRKIKFAPIYVLEMLGNLKYFKELYYSDKSSFFEKYRFQMMEQYECNYTVVMSMKKMSAINKFQFAERRI